MSATPDQDATLASTPGPEAQRQLDFLKDVWSVVIYALALLREHGWRSDGHGWTPRDP